jgi:hypothetical protein
MATSQFSGVPWLEVGQEKKVGPNALTANCLCKGHNSALSPLDAAAALFVSALRESMEAATAPNPYLFSGHDIERWLLKTLKAMAVSGNLARGRKKLAGAFKRDIDIIRMLDDHGSWPAGSGLYFIMSSGSRLVNDTRFRIQPWFDAADDEIVGLWTSIVGLQFVMMIAAPEAGGVDMGRSLFRPSCVDISIGQSRRLVELSWDDELKHDPLTMTFERSVQA